MTDAAQTSTSTSARSPFKWLTLARLRAYTGLVLTLFVLSHLLNHAVGIISVGAMTLANPIFMAFWKTPIGTILLAGSFFVHFGVACWNLYRRRTLSLGWKDTAQWITGLAIPFLLIDHAVGARAPEEIMANADITYRLVVASLWVIDPVDGLLRGSLILVCWAHVCLGLYMWWSPKPWFDRWVPALVPIAILVPTLAVSGFVSAGVEIATEWHRDHRWDAILAEANIDPYFLPQVTLIADSLTFGMLAFSLLPFAGRFARDVLAKSRKRAAVMLPDGRNLDIEPGGSVLEALRSAGIPHAAVCGGRGRCTTCRIRVRADQEGSELPPPTEIEAKALARIGAADGVRLACQLRPVQSLAIVPLLPPTASPQDGRRPGGIEGDERRVTALFVDLRRSTALGEEKLPFDVLFILNQFFAEMSTAIHETDGHYAQFNGDGLMALYGLGAKSATGERDAARAAIEGAAAMLRRVEGLNKSLQSELPFPLKVGIGLHTGEAIVGAMGPPRAQITSAIGDTINIAARLEALTKEHDVCLVMSATTAETAELSMDLAEAEHVPRGRETALKIHPVADVGAVLKSFAPSA